ncbi:hypothetical protein CANARDRAFT_194833, partial [[Candida] arabinofermentans NRRL YB-2248]
IAKPSLSPEQKALIEKNRQRALERKNSREGIKSGNLKDATKNITANSLDSVRITKDIIADNNTANNTIRERTRPSVLRSDYIEYDFSTMTDTFGGFLADTTSSDPRDPTKDKTLDEWKEGVQSKNFMDQAPPIDPANSPKCFECKTSIEIDPILLKAFGCRVCKTCKEKFPEKYSLLTKTECKEDYFLTDPELQDETLFRRIIKANPHSGTFSKMQLFMRYQIEEFAFKKWGSEEALDKEWLRREEMRIKRRDKSLNQQSDILLDNTPLSEDDLYDYFPTNLDEDSEIVTYSELERVFIGDKLDLKVGDQYYAEKLPNMWYVKSSLISTLLFALDYLLPTQYSNLESIDLILITPGSQKTVGLFEQSINTEFQMMKLALSRNIPVLNVNGLMEEQFSVSSILDLNNNGMESTNELPLAFCEKIQDLISSLSNQHQFGTHNFRSSRALIKSKNYRDYMENEAKNNNPRLLPNGVGLNINLHMCESCKTASKNLKFVQTRSVGGYNKIPAMAFDEETNNFNLDLVYNIDKNLRHMNTNFLSELSIDGQDSSISVTPISWLGFDYDQTDFLSKIISELNHEEIEEEEEEEEDNDDTAFKLDTSSNSSE